MAQQFTAGFGYDIDASKCHVEVTLLFPSQHNRPEAFPTYVHMRMKVYTHGHTRSHTGQRSRTHTCGRRIQTARACTEGTCTEGTGLLHTGFPAVVVLVCNTPQAGQSVKNELTPQIEITGFY